MDCNRVRRRDRNLQLSRHVLNPCVCFIPVFFYLYRCCTICKRGIFAPHCVTCFVFTMGPVLLGSDMKGSTVFGDHVYHPYRTVETQSKTVEESFKVKNKIY